MASKNTTINVESRITELEKRAGLSHETQDVIDRVQAKGAPIQTSEARAQKTFRFLANDVVAPADVVDVIFDIDKTTTTAFMVRLYFDGADHGDDVCNNTDTPHGVVPRKIVGSSFDLVMDVAGNPNDVGAFTVRNASPTSLKLKVSEGPISIKHLVVTG